jgi:hypothetical protein
MRTGAKVFLGSATFALVISMIYWFVTSEPTGTALLVSMILAPGLMAAYAASISSGPRAPQDRPDAHPSAPDASVFGPVVPGSIWPITLGGGAFLVAAGLAYGVWLLLPAGAVFLVTLAGLARD